MPHIAISICIASWSVGHSEDTCAQSKYQVRSLGRLGAEVLGLDLRKPICESLRQSLEREAARTGVLRFSSQGLLQPEEFINASKLFGGRELQSRHTVHPSASRDDILRLSNDAMEGIQGVGPQWHSDGSMERQVFSHVLFNAETMPELGGETQFADLAAAYEALSRERKEEWARLASVNAYSGAVHPLVHQHPVSGKLVLYLHLGQTGAVIRWPTANKSSGHLQHGVEGGRFIHMDSMHPMVGESLRGQGFQVLSRGELIDLFHTFDELLSRPENRLTFRYQPGDLLVVDNLAVAHRAASTARDTANGLRVLHRTTVKGTTNLDPPATSRLPPFLYIFGDNPMQDGGVWQSADYYGVGFRWNHTIHMQN